MNPNKRLQRLVPHENLPEGWIPPERWVNIVPVDWRLRWYLKTGNYPKPFKVKGGGKDYL